VSWKKYWKTAPTSNEIDGVYGAISGRNDRTPPDYKHKNFQSPLPEIYRGHPNRIERYQQYEQMNMDGEINSALDIMSEFSTQLNIENGTAFDLYFKEAPTDTEITIIKEHLRNWWHLNEFDKRIFKLFRNVLQYGDQLFIRDPENYKLNWVDMTKVTKVIVNEGEGKKQEFYIIRDIDPNFENLSATTPAYSDEYTLSPNAGGGVQGGGGYQMPTGTNAGGGRFQKGQNDAAIEAEHIVHLSLTEGMDITWPFGNSILEQVFKVYKQKELLEDAIIIYRIQRAPERRVFNIDVGSMPSHLAMAFVERIKNEIHQRRIPTQSGGSTQLDATYNPLSINEDYFFPKTLDGRGSSIDTLQGGQNLDQIDDLRFFTNKMYRTLRIPSSYLPTGPDDSTNTYNDGRMGTALIQEYRFNQYCTRLQNLIVSKLDEEFKMFMGWRGITIDESMFELRFNQPQNFASYRQTELDTARISVFASMSEIPYISKRFALKRYLGMSEEEMADNDKLWAEEQGIDEILAAEDNSMRAAGITTGDISGDLDNLDMSGDEFDDPELTDEEDAEVSDMADDLDLDV